MGDKILRCKICHQQFYFTEKDQLYCKKNHKNIPDICFNCRRKRIPRRCETCTYRYTNEGESYFGYGFCDIRPFAFNGNDVCDEWKLRKGGHRIATGHGIVKTRR